MVFPEYQMLMPDFENPERVNREAEAISGPFMERMVESARKYSTNLVVSIVESNFGSLRPFNTSTVVTELGGLVERKYQKVHLNARSGPQERRVFEKGGYAPIEPFYVGELNIGILKGEDILYPEQARYLTLLGSEVLVVQAAWSSVTDISEMWFPILRTRAVENSCFVIASDNAGGGQFYGHSCVISPPLGQVISDAGQDECVIHVDIDLDLLRVARGERVTRSRTGGVTYTT